MFEILFQKNPALFIPVIVIVGTAVVFTIWIVCHYFHSSRRAEIDAALKQDMLNRGMTAADIERVLLASSERQEPIDTPEPVTDNEYYLVEKMLDDGHSIDEVERVVRAFKTGQDGTAKVAKKDAISDNEYALVEKMLNNGHSIDEIERIVRAFTANKEKSLHFQAHRVEA